jgi:glycerate dehydrogenase
MKFVVLDGFLSNFDNIGLSINEHRQVWYDTTAPEEVIPHIQDADGVIVNRVHITKEVLDACPNIRYIGVTGTGYNMVDLNAARDKNITVCNVPVYGTDAVAQHTIAMLLEIVAKVGEFNALVHSGKWTREDSPEVVSIKTYELAGKTLGIFGAGAIGRKVAKIAYALDMNIIAYDTYPSKEPQFGFIKYVDIETLFKQSDVLSIHSPLNDRTRGFFTKDVIDKMKDGAILLNAARGAIVDEKAVLDALNSGKLVAMGADVMNSEPPNKDNPIYNHPKAVITPHVAWMPRETRQRLLDIVSENILMFINGTPQNVIV